MTLLKTFLATKLDTLTTYEIISDGKTKYFWSHCTHGHKQCWVCSAYGLQLSKDLREKPQFKAKNRRFLKYGFANCHSRINGINYFKTFAYNKDFKTNDCRYILLT